MRKSIYRYYVTVHRSHTRLGFRSGNCPFCQAGREPRHAA